MNMTVGNVYMLDTLMTQAGVWPPHLTAGEAEAKNLHQFPFHPFCHKSPWWALVWE